MHLGLDHGGYWLERRGLPHPAHPPYRRSDGRRRPARASTGRARADRPHRAAPAAGGDPARLGAGRRFARRDPRRDRAACRRVRHAADRRLRSPACSGCCPGHEVDQRLDRRDRQRDRGRCSTRIGWTAVPDRRWRSSGRRLLGALVPILAIFVDLHVAASGSWTAHDVDRAQGRSGARRSTRRRAIGPVRGDPRWSAVCSRVDPGRRLVVPIVVVRSRGALGRRSRHAERCVYALSDRWF